MAAAHPFARRPTGDTPGRHLIRAVAALAVVANTAAWAQEPAGLHVALDQLTRKGRFSGAVVVHGADGVLFARGYGLADPFTGRRFTPDTPADSGSLAKPVTAAAALLLAREGTIDLDAPVRRYLPEFPHAATGVRHLLAQSAGLPFDNSPEALAGKTNAQLVAAARRRDPLFVPGSAFAYCNLCYVTLALLVERVTGADYLEFARNRLALPRGVRLRPQRLADWQGRAIGYRRGDAGKPERFDSWPEEAFYGSANLSVTARQLAEWGTHWWQQPLSSIRGEATAPAMIAGRTSGLSWGSWYCAAGGRRCHYLGHHEGFHHMLYWDADRRISVAMLSNNTLAPALQQRLQRSLVAFAEGRGADARRELTAPLPDRPVSPNEYGLPGGETIGVHQVDRQLTVARSGIEYPAYLIGSGIRYIPGLDVYIAGSADGRLHWLSLYEDFLAVPVQRR